MQLHLGLYKNMHYGRLDYDTVKAYMQILMNQWIGIEVMMYFRIWEVLSSNLGQDTGYHA
jgi:hypothetical protein